MYLFNCAVILKCWYMWKYGPDNSVLSIWSKKNNIFNYLNNKCVRNFQNDFDRKYMQPLVSALSTFIVTIPMFFFHGFRPFFTCCCSLCDIVFICDSIYSSYYRRSHIVHLLSKVIKNVEKIIRWIIEHLGRSKLINEKQLCFWQQKSIEDLLSYVSCYGRNLLIFTGSRKSLYLTVQSIRHDF